MGISMKRLETKQVMVVYCDACGEECLNNYTSWRDASTNQEIHACDKLDDEGLTRVCVEEIERRRLERALARRASNTEVARAIGSQSCEAEHRQ
jgi:uncharacterized cysteine cluster protein YcgN (CxxCxxCC family)